MIHEKTIIVIDAKPHEYNEFKQMVNKHLVFCDVHLIESLPLDIEQISQINPDFIIIKISQINTNYITIQQLIRADRRFDEKPILFLVDDVLHQQQIEIVNGIMESGFLINPVKKEAFLIKLFELASHHKESKANHQVNQLNQKITTLEIDLKRCLDAEQEIIETKEFYHDLFDKSPMGYQSLDINGNFLEVNKKWTEIFGIKREDVIGKNFSDFLLPECHSNFKEKFDQFKKVGHAHGEFQMYGANNALLDIEFEGKVVLKEPNSEFQTMCVLENITEIKQAQKQIEISEEKYRTLVTKMPLGLAVYEATFDDEGKPINYRLLNVNQAYVDITGLDPNERLGKTIKDVFSKETYNLLKSYEPVVHQGHNARFEQYFPSIDKYLDISAYYTTFNHLAAVVTDVTERVLLNKALSIEKQRLSRVVESTADIIFEIGTDKKFISVYGKGLKKIGHTPLDYKGRTVLDVFGKDGLSRDRSYSEALNGNSVSYKWEFETSEGILYFESNIAPIYDEKNHVIGAVGIARDITNQKKIQDDIEYMSNHDYLTDLYNRRYFVSQLKILNAVEYYPLGVMMLDLNGLKIFNDAYGHKMGDQALIKLTKVLKNVFKKNEIISRIGGDEFSVIIPTTSEEELYEYKQLVINEVSKIKTENIEMSVAIGYDIVTRQNRNINEVQKNAENFMYRHKFTEGMSTRNHAIQAILQTLTDKYKEEKIHSQRVSDLCVELGRAYKLDNEDLKELEQAGMYHDIGKISIPDAILDKPSRLTEEEFGIIKTHTEVGYNILRAADEYSDLAEHALYHHERWDGKGYPEGLKGESIPLFSRIICICDSFEAMTADRAYKKKMTLEEAHHEIERCSGSQFDPDLAKLFVTEVLQKKWNK